jgi:hypothetical protein
LIAHLLLEIEQGIPLCQTLLQLIIDLRWGCPRRRAEHHRQLRQRLGINSIGFGPFQQGFGEVMRLGRVNDTHLKPRLDQAGGQRDPIGPGGFHHHEHLDGRRASGTEFPLQVGIPLWGLLDHDGTTDFLSRTHPRHGGGGGRNIDSNEQAIGYG